MLLPHSCGLQRQPGKKRLSVNHTSVCCVYPSPIVRGVSLHIQAGSMAALSADRRSSVTKQQGDWHPSRPPPGAPLDAVHIAGCFKFLSLEELSCMISFQSLFCLLTGELSECFFFVIRGMFSSRWKEGCARIPFREISIWNSLSVTLTQKWSVETEFNRMMLTFLTQEKRFFFLSFLTNDTHTNLKVEHDSFHNHQTFLLN